MNRRKFTIRSLLSLAVLPLLGLLPKRKPFARLLNNEKGTWYGGSPRQVCEGESALLYEDDHRPRTREQWRAEIAQLVKDGYAEYV